MKLCCEMPFKPNFEQYLKSEDVEVRLSALQIWFSNGIESEMKIHKATIDKTTIEEMILNESDGQCFQIQLKIYAKFEPNFDILLKSFQKWKQNEEITQILLFEMAKSNISQLQTRISEFGEVIAVVISKRPQVLLQIIEHCHHYFNFQSFEKLLSIRNVSL